MARLVEGHAESHDRPNGLGPAVRRPCDDGGTTRRTCEGSAAVAYVSLWIRSEPFGMWPDWPPDGETIGFVDPANAASTKRPRDG